LSDQLLEVEQGSFYPAVYRTWAAKLDQLQVGVTETGRLAKFYTLTKAGTKHRLTM